MALSWSLVTGDVTLLVFELTVITLGRKCLFSCFRMSNQYILGINQNQFHATIFAEGENVIKQ